MGLIEVEKVEWSGEMERWRDEEVEKVKKGDGGEGIELIR